MNISTAIRNLVKKFNQHPYDINDGNCELFAMEIIKMFPKAEMFWGDELPDFFPPNHIDPSIHCFIKFQDRFYDAEEPDGTLLPIFLPLYIRQCSLKDMNWAFEWLAKNS